jgi:Asp-tRNA(Asn)/Glu-tRNA(Gln) amidotransferase A subunit family amidase
LPKSGAKGVNELFSQFRACSAGLAGILVPGAARSALTRAEQERWRATMAAAMHETGLLALATVPFFRPRLDTAIRPGYLALTSPENLAGFPAFALPVPTGQQLPASLQLIGGPNAEALLLATGIGLSGGLPGRLTCRASEPGAR